MSATSDPSITLVSEGETETRRRLEEIAADAFATPQDYLVSLSAHTLAARVDGEVVGGVVLDIIDGSAGDVGIVSWLFTSPSAQGRGVGDRLVDAALDYLVEQGCRAVVTVVQWPNTASSALFARREFRRISSSTLLKRFGPKQGGLVWLKTFHFVNVGCDLWYLELPGEESLEPSGCPPEKPANATDRATSDSGVSSSRGRQRRSPLRTARRFSETVLVHVVLLAIVVGGLDVQSWGLTTVGLAVTAGVLLSLRWAPYAVFTSRDRRQWVFWSWGNVYPFAGAIAVFGGFLPVPGHITPERSEWDYRDELSVLGPAATAWGVLLLATLLGVVAMSEWVGASGWLEAATLESLVLTLTVFVVVDLWVIVWPFDSYNGRVVYDWNRVVWAVLSGIAALVLVVYYFG